MQCGRGDAEEDHVSGNAQRLCGCPGKEGQGRRIAQATTVVQTPSLCPSADWVTLKVRTILPLILYCFSRSSHAVFGVEVHSQRRRQHGRGEIFSVLSRLFVGFAERMVLGEVAVRDDSAGWATPMDAATRRFGSFVAFLAITANVICPGCRSLSPSSVGIRLQPGGKMLETVTRLHFSILASRVPARTIAGSPCGGLPPW